MAKKTDSPVHANGADRPAAQAVSNTAGAAPASGEPPQLSPEMIGKIAELRTRIQLSVGQVVLAIMNLPRYRHQTLADLMHVVLDPLMRDRVAIAYTRTEGKPEGDEQSVAGIAIWASVSDAVDAKITEQVKAGVFPVRMANEDWVSGDTLWLLDVIAGDRKQATAVLANFRQLSGERPVKVHPIVARSVDPGVLEKMRVRGGEGAETIPESPGSA
ncbi:MAG: toxin-activating lysine-acyltransferase [Sphingomonas bacterium]